MNMNEYKLRALTQEIQYYEKENKTVQDYLKIKQERDVVLNELSKSW